MSIAPWWCGIIIARKSCSGFPVIGAASIAAIMVAIASCMPASKLTGGESGAGPCASTRESAAGGEGSDPDSRLRRLKASVMMVFLPRRAAGARPHVDQVDALLVAQLARRQRQDAEGDLRHERRREGVRDVEGAADGLPRRRRAR